MVSDPNEKIMGEVNTDDALALADSFSEACRNGELIPVWAQALRTLAGGYRRQSGILGRLEDKQEAQRILNLPPLNLPGRSDAELEAELSAYTIDELGRAINLKRRGLLQ
jgi:hypothetical protein